MKWVVCSTCEGAGRCAHRGLDGDGFTQSEWSEITADDEDFRENYLNGAYDTTCPDCDGLRVVEAPDLNCPEEVDEYNSDTYAAWQDDQERDAERKFGC